MTKPTARQRSDRTPAWLTAARAFYGSAFEVSSPEELAVTMADWTEMSEAERSFVQTHLLYLNLLAQRGTQRLFAALRRTLGEFGEEALELLEALDIDEERPEDDDEVDEVDPGLDYADQIETAEPVPERRLELVRDEAQTDENEDDDDENAPEAS